MSRYDEYYDIRMAEIDDIPLIMNFINTNWKKGHILATNRMFFEYEMVTGSEVNFILAISKHTGKIEGLHGFIPASKSKDKLDIWGVIWKVTDYALPMLGIELKRQLTKLTGARFEIGVGANPNTTVPILRFLGYYTAKMHHYYMVSRQEDYKIALVKHYEKNNYIQRNLFIEEVGSFRELKKKFDFTLIKDTIPYKDEWYIEHRYFKHPIFQYKLFVIGEKANANAVLVVREQNYNDAKVLRIVDYLGKAECFASLGNFFDGILSKYEYIDFYFEGFPEEYVRQAGFINQTDDDHNIIPDYFYPFERKNITIWVNSNRKGCVFFKADGDQDRPS